MAISSPHLSSKIQYPAMWIVGLCVVDIITTIIAISMGAIELNPVAYLLGGMVVFLIIKAIATITLSVIVVLRNNGKKIYGNNIFTKQINQNWLWVAVALMGLVIINNLVVIGIHLIV
jgi:hypothetical protein